MQPKQWIALALAAGLAGCTTSAADLARQGSTTERQVAGNYQEVYRRVSTMARQCLQGAPLGGFGAYHVEAQLYPDLGFGEVTYALANVQQNYYASARISHQAEGARIAVSSLVPGLQAPFLAWAEGASTCA